MNILGLNITCKSWRGNLSNEKHVKSYYKNGRKPWSTGYSIVKKEFIKNSLKDSSLLVDFRKSELLPFRYGEFLDERVVEYPWLLSRLDDKPGKLLDAGSILNFSHILEHARLRKRDISIVTLDPEARCFWKKGISYLYEDLRELPFRDEWFDEVVSLSTLEHIGMDNSIYTNNPAFVEKRPADYVKAVSELRRVVKDGGKVYISVPFGKNLDYGWFQQFDKGMIDTIISTFAPSRFSETFFKYEGGGWQMSDRNQCGECESFDIHATKYYDPESSRDYDDDFAASSRAVAALEMWK